MKTNRLLVLKSITVLLLLLCNVAVMAQTPGVGGRVSITWGDNGVKVNTQSTVKRPNTPPGIRVIPTYMNRGLDPLEKKQIENASVKGPEIDISAIRKQLSGEADKTADHVGQSPTTGLLNVDSALQRRIELHQNASDPLLPNIDKPDSISTSDIE